MTADHKLGRAWLDRICNRLLFDFSDCGFSASERINWEARGNCSPIDGRGDDDETRNLSGNT
jgi:hypothetical protein